MSVTYFGVDLLTFDPVSSGDSFKGNLLKAWLKLEAESSKRAAEAYETYWGPEAEKNKTCPSNHSHYFIKETPGAARYQLIRDRSKSPDKTSVSEAFAAVETVVGDALAPTEKKEEKPKKSPAKKKAKTKEPEPEKVELKGEQ